jgi:hypothetical protein
VLAITVYLAVDVGSLHTVWLHSRSITLRGAPYTPPGDMTAAR